MNKANTISDNDEITVNCKSTPTTTTCPQHVLNEIEACAGSGVVAIKECKSAQQQVWIVTCTVEQPLSSSSVDNIWRDALSTGQNRLVIRLWNGGCQWWNLNQNTSPHSLAQTELMGYRLAHRALQHHGIVIPRVLKFCHTMVSTATGSELSKPWAILEYVGPDSFYLEANMEDTTWIESMIPMRHEFGFDEPHPRWGRVPSSQALQYATMVLDQVIIPLHLGSKDIQPWNDDAWIESSRTTTADTVQFPCFTYKAMISKYEQVYQSLMEHLVSAHYHQQQQNLEDLTDFQRWDGVMALVQDAIYNVMPTNHSQIITRLGPPLPSMVLVHLDLQPQNLLFSRRNDDPHDGTHSSSTKTRVVSVLDWEDAAMADPRFELLLLGRKVCATREQAEAVWQRYIDRVNVNLGPLKPWLQLEACHSILTLLLQSMNLLNGGRNPWETSKDLWDKLEREMARWKSLLAEQEDWQNESSFLPIQESQGNHEAKSNDAYFADLGIHPEMCYRQSEHL